MIERRLESAAETEALGAELAAWLERQPGGVVYLCGSLGSGKTTLARGVLRALGVEGPIRSPTYTLLEPYPIGQKHLLHMDLYRLQAAEEVEQLGLRDYPPACNWWLVEWPERGQGYLPPPQLSIEMSHAGERRLAAINGLQASSLEAVS